MLNAFLIESIFQIEACITNELLTGPKVDTGGSATASLLELLPSVGFHRNGSESNHAVVSILTEVEATEKVEAAPTVAQRPLYDSVPNGMGNGKLKVTTTTSAPLKIEVTPMGKSCQSPLVEDDPEEQKSNEEKANGELDESDTDPAETGLVKGGAGDKKAVFKFDDPNTFTENDYHLHSCECFFQDWGQMEPVTAQSFEAAAKGSMEVGMSFNRLSPDPVLLWNGPYICDLRFLIAQDVETMSCAMSCNDISTCKYFVVSNRVCMLFSDCQYMTRVSTNFIGKAYAVHQRGTNSALCHIADPDRCWAETRRRAYLTGKNHRFGKCMWEHLHEQCDFNRLMGDSEIEDCKPCTYMEAKNAPVKRAMPSRFPHGARLTVGCDDNYALIAASSAANQITCIDGEWRDDTGKI
eukprot:564185-Amorphochlora_amoeboformis.AAC.1